MKDQARRLRPIDRTTRRATLLTLESLRIEKDASMGVDACICAGQRCAETPVSIRPRSLKKSHAPSSTLMLFSGKADLSTCR